MKPRFLALVALLAARAHGAPMERALERVVPSPAPQGAPAPHPSALAGADAGIPAELSAYYGALPDGGLSKLAEDPVAAQLRASGAQYWALRHGQSENVRQRLFAGPDSRWPLTAEPDREGASGVLQAYAAGARMFDSLGGDGWAQEVFDGRRKPLVILHSPTVRAVQTAQIMLAAFEAKGRSRGAPSAKPLYEMHLEPAIAEMDFGRLEGTSWDKADENLGWKFDDRNMRSRFPGGESLVDVMVRQREFFKRLATRWAGRDVVAVSHNLALNAQLAVLDLWPKHPDGAMKLGDLPHAQPVLLNPSRP